MTRNTDLIRFQAATKVTGKAFTQNKRRAIPHRKGGNCSPAFPCELNMVNMIDYKVKNLSKR